MGLVELSNLTPVLTVADAKAHLNVDTTAADAYLGSIVLAATAWLEQQTNLALTARDYRLTLDEWPATGTVYVPRPPLVEVEAITIDGTPLDPASYTVDADAFPGRIIAAGEIAKPTAPAGIVITYSAGYATVPAPLVHAARLLVGGWFLNREAAQDRTISTLPAAVALESIVASYRMPFAGGHSV